MSSIRFQDGVLHQASWLSVLSRTVALAFWRTLICDGSPGPRIPGCRGLPQREYNLDKLPYITPWARMSKSPFKHSMRRSSYPLCADSAANSLQEVPIPCSQNGGLVHDNDRFLGGAGSPWCIKDQKKASEVQMGNCCVLEYEI